MTRYMDEEDKDVGRNVTEVTFYGVNSGVEEVVAIGRLM